MTGCNKPGNDSSLIWEDHIKEIPDNNYYLSLSCILGAMYPASEAMVPKVYDMLGINWNMNPGPSSGWTCCTGIGFHGDILPIETTLSTVARLWSIAQEMGLDAVTMTCVTSFGIHCECKELLLHEAGLKKKIDKILYNACGRKFEIPDHVLHVSDIYYHFRDRLAADHMKYRLVDRATGRPLRVVDHVGCHYSKLFPEKYSTGGSEYCRVLSDMVNSWGGESTDYPERRHCCGMGFRQCMITPNRGGTMASSLKKFRSMAPFQPDMVITNCPGCQTFMDKMQFAICEITGEEYNIPVLTYQETAGLLLGWDPYETVGVQFHTVPVEPLLDRIGIPYNEKKAGNMQAAAEIN
ncbi:MAG: heterodisulfide reductase subunit B [Spirochaetes bacterium]|nr:heterodisulfide reductase subunit B [Spirochaetota bacterium]